MCLTCILQSISWHFQYFGFLGNLAEYRCSWLFQYWQALSVNSTDSQLTGEDPLSLSALQANSSAGSSLSCYVLNGEFIWVFMWQRSNFDFFFPPPHGFVLLSMPFIFLSPIGQADFLISFILLVCLIKFSPSTSVLNFFFQLEIQRICIQFAKVFIFSWHTSMTSLFEGHTFACFLNGFFFLVTLTLFFRMQYGVFSRLSASKNTDLFACSFQFSLKKLPFFSMTECLQLEGT